MFGNPDYVFEAERGFTSANPRIYIAYGVLFMICYLVFDYVYKEYKKYNDKK